MFLNRRTLFYWIMLVSLGISQSYLPIIGSAQPVYDLAPLPPEIGSLETVKPNASTGNLSATEPLTSLTDDAYLVATNAGLFRFQADGSSQLILAETSVRSIIQAGDQWFTLSDQGILASTNLSLWMPRNNGLPVKTIKQFQAGLKSFSQIIADLKDLEADPADPLTLVTATKDRVFLTRDGGQSWRDIGFPHRTNGLKAVAVASLPQTVVLVSHAIYGIYYFEVDTPGAVWKSLSAGLTPLATSTNPDEVADIKVIQPEPNGPATIYVSQTFIPRIYRLDWPAKTFRLVWSAAAAFGSIDSLYPIGSGLCFLTDSGVKDFQPDSGAVSDRLDIQTTIFSLANAIGSTPQVVAALQPAGRAAWICSELWLLSHSFKPSLEARLEAAYGREGLYLPPNHPADPELLARHLATIEARNLNLAVVDMKDDYGRLRFNPRSPRLLAMGKVYNPIDLEKFVGLMKDRGVWLVARIVVFKDPVLAKWDGGKLAVWDNSLKQAWAGYYNTKLLVEDPLEAAATEPVYEYVKTYYDESWVDPYSEEVWAYIGDLAQELIERGFDEIQFDYIRFPTDGINLADAVYRWQDAGMDMESAILSFLAYIRGRLDAPISVDIYGANGWYRTGARTGQEVEMMVPYVDIICPMYYPSHFEQGFLAQAPAVDRPYRIYYQGTLRAHRIARGRVIIRPYVQAFFLNVSYDQIYYSPDYVRLEVQGIRDAGSPGLTYWNNSGRYDDIPSARQL